MTENLESRNKHDRSAEFFSLKFYFNIRDSYKQIAAFFGMHDF